MKYLLLVGMLFSLSSPVFAQEEEILKRMDAIGAKLEIAAAKLGVATEHMWGVLVRQQFIDGCVKLSGFVLCFVFCIYILLLLHKRDVENDVFLLGVAVITVLCVIFVCNASTIVTQIFNPEYHAAMSIKEMFGK